MSPCFLESTQIDSRLGWRDGRSARLAKRGVLPHYILPDGSKRFVWDEVAALIRHVQPAAGNRAERGAE